MAGYEEGGGAKDLEVYFSGVRLTYVFELHLGVERGTRVQKRN